MPFTSLKELIKDLPKPDKDFKLDTSLHFDTEQFLHYRKDLSQMFRLTIEALSALDEQPMLVIASGSRIAGSRQSGEIPKDKHNDLDIFVMWPNQWVPSDVSRGDQPSKLYRIREQVNQYISHNFKPDIYYPTPPRVHITPIAWERGDSTDKIIHAISSGIIICGDAPK